MGEEKITNYQDLMNKIKNFEDELVILKKAINEKDSKSKLTLNGAFITADKDVVVINENVSFTASFPDMIGKTVSFYNGSDFLGTSVTNDDGVASLTTSFGVAQVVNVHAICEDMSSEICVIKVGIFVYLNGGDTTLTSENLNPSNLKITGDFALEFDIKQTDTSGQVKIALDGRNYTVTTHIGISHSNGTLVSYREGTSDGHHYLPSISTPSNNWYHIKMTREGSVFTWYIDDTLISIKILFTLGTEIINTIKGLKPNNGVGIVKNLVIYPI